MRNILSPDPILVLFQIYIAPKIGWFDLLLQETSVCWLIGYIWSWWMPRHRLSWKISIHSWRRLRKLWGWVLESNKILQFLSFVLWWLSFYFLRLFRNGLHYREFALTVFTSCIWLSLSFSLLFGQVLLLRDYHKASLPCFRLLRSRILWLNNRRLLILKVRSIVDAIAFGLTRFSTIRIVPVYFCLSLQHL